MANLFDFSAEFQGVDDAVGRQQGAVYNEPDPFVIPGSNSTASTRDEAFAGQNYVPPGNFYPYQESVNPDTELNQLETAEIAGLNAANNAFAPIPVTTPTVTLDPVVVTATDLRSQQPLINPLHEYDSYTYNLSLHAITTEQFNNLSQNPNGYIPQNVLIAGAGKYSSTFRRNSYFQEDFYFDNLDMESIINTKKVNRFSNVINIEFTIIEPLGFTLIQRLVSACEAPTSQGGVGGQNYLKQPFILQIDFYGQKDGNIGAGIIPNQTKLIPIRLISMQTSISYKGTEYRISAVPFNHNAFDPTKINLPATFTVKAATVADIFSSGTVDIQASDQEARTAIENQIFNNTLAEYNDLADAFGPGTQTLGAKSTLLGTQGVANAYNSYYKILEEKNNTKHDRIKFVLDPELGNALLYEQGPNDVSAVAGTDNQQVEQQGNKSTINFNSGYLTIPAGSNIQSIIEWAVTNSKFMRDQIIGQPNTGPAQAQQTEIPLKLVKIVPSVRILDYDKIRDNYRYEITYYIKKYLANSRAPNAPQGRVKGWVKEYNYIYTGGTSPYTGDNASNRDVISVNLDFNMLFYTTVTAFKDKAKLFNTAPTNAAGGDDLRVLNKEVNPGSGFPGDPGNIDSTGTVNATKLLGLEDPVNRAEVYYNAGNKRNVLKTGGSAAAAQTAADILNSQLLDARGDMINVQLTITGDPHFIKQDDILYNQNLVGQTSQLTPNNSLYTDNGELYVFLRFRSPIDYDENTGLAVPGFNNFSYSLFSGVYKVITVTNKFTGGQFIQVLDLVRLPISDESRIRDVQQSFRSTNAFEIGSGQNARFSDLPNFGQRIAGTIFSGGFGAQGVQQLAQGLIQKAFNENVQPVIVKQIGRLSDSIFGGISDLFGGGSAGGIDLDLLDLEVGDASLFTNINYDLDALNALEDAFGNFDTDLINSIDLTAGLDNFAPAFDIPDVDFLGEWL